MRQEDINTLTEAYTQPRDQFDRRFHSSIGADVPSAGTLVREIFNDFDTTNYGISWWQSVPVHERILIGAKTTARKELVLLHSERNCSPGTTRGWLKVSLIFFVKFILLITMKH